MPLLPAAARPCSTLCVAESDAEAALCGRGGSGDGEEGGGGDAPARDRGALGTRALWTRGAGLALAACAVGLVCALHFRRQSGAQFGEAKGEATQLDEGVIYWLGSPDRCLDANGTWLGAPVKVRACWPPPSLVFPKRSGMIRLVSNTSLCVGPEHGAAVPGRKLVLRLCDESDPAMDWQLPEDVDGGLISLRRHPSVCLDGREHGQAQLGVCPLMREQQRKKKEKEKKKELELEGAAAGWRPDYTAMLGQLRFNGSWCLGTGDAFWPKGIFMSGDCDGWLAPTHWKFYLERPTDIRFAANTSFCLTQQEDENGTRTVGLDFCHEAGDDGGAQQWLVPSSSGQIQLAGDPTLCVKPPSGEGPLLLRPCKAEKHGDMQFEMLDRSKHWDTPSLYCVSVAQPWGYEQDLFTTLLGKMQEDLKDMGIFDCNAFHVFSTFEYPIRLGWHHRVGEVQTTHFPSSPVGISKDGTAGNTQLFINMWGTVHWLGTYLEHDWTLKLDPDAVFIPSRMRGLLWPHTNQDRVYFKNCNSKAGEPDYPMMFGAVEVFSRNALDKYNNDLGPCFWLPWGQWGEDLFMKKCMDQLGVGSIFDDNLVGDALCFKDRSCTNWHPAYHPYKQKWDWINCWYTATNSGW